MATLTAQEIQNAVSTALKEDIGSGDATTLATIPKEAQALAMMRSREPLVVAGLEFAEAAFHSVGSRVKSELLSHDGARLSSGENLLRVSGDARGLLSAERVALNFVQRMSGVATITAAFVDAVKGTNARILDTRKTTPGWRRFEKYAVACGGGTNHRSGLHDMVMIKDNHLTVLRDAHPNAIAAAVQRARDKYPELRVEVETDTLEQVKQAVEARADFILLDNMDLNDLREAVRLTAGKAKTEASGGVSLATVRAIAETGVDFISVGAITHSVPAVDIGLDFEAGL